MHALTSARHVLVLLGRRALLLVALLAITFLAVDVLPGDAASTTLGREGTPEDLAMRRAQLGLDLPVWERFVRWFTGLCTGDLGSTAHGQPISDLVADRFPDTLVLGVTALLITVAAALLLGAASVLRPSGPLAHAIGTGAAIALAVPEFVMATTLIAVFASGLRWFPATTSADTDGITATMLVLPVLALAAPQIGWNTRMVRATLAEQLCTPHVDAAILDGLSRWRILTHYLLPGAAPAIAAAVATSIGMVLGGAVAIEASFNYPGLGSVLVGAIQQRDAPTVAAVVALTGVAITVVLLLCDGIRMWARGSIR